MVTSQTIPMLPVHCFQTQFVGTRAETVYLGSGNPHKRTSRRLTAILFTFYTLSQKRD